LLYNINITMFWCWRLRSLDTQRSKVAVSSPAINYRSSIHTSSHSSIRFTKSDLNWKQIFFQLQYIQEWTFQKQKKYKMEETKHGLSYMLHFFANDLNTKVYSKCLSCFAATIHWDSIHYHFEYGLFLFIKNYI